jgi:hypothetical protein
MMSLHNLSTSNRKYIKKRIDHLLIPSLKSIQSKSFTDHSPIFILVGLFDIITPIINHTDVLLQYPSASISFLPCGHLISNNLVNIKQFLK